MKEIELIEKRRSREKHFLREDGTFVAKIYDKDVHFFKNGKYEEIDNQLIKENDYYTNINNSYKVKFNESSKNELMSMESNGHFLNIKLKESKEKLFTKVLKQSKLINDITYEDIMDNIDLEYKVLPRKVKESIIIKNKKNIPSDLLFEVETDLKLIINPDKSISAYKDNNIYFKLEPPYMIDSENKINRNIFYSVSEVNNKYELTLVIDTEWLKREDVVYPVIIDPTITDSEESTTVYDTYIYPGDNGVNKNNQPFIKAGVEKINNVNVTNRALIKFNLPTLNTGDQILYAELDLIGYILGNNEASYPQIVNIHQMLEDWDETNATWETLNNKFNSKIETCFYAQRSQYFNGAIDPVLNFANITNLVRKWYTDTPNYGLMIKSNSEIYQNNVSVPSFYSKNHNISNYDAKPVLTVVYRNQNGVEEYINTKQQVFKNGSVFCNTNTGNITSIFDLAKIPGSKMSTNLKLIYNTNDVLLNNNYGYGTGFKLNVIQTIEDYNIGSINYKKYVDADGTIHYFEEINGEFINDDGIGLNLLIENNKYILKDKNEISMIFTPSNNGKHYLTSVRDEHNNEILITYNTDNKVIKIVDSCGKFIDISYSNELISVTADNLTTLLSYSNNKIIKITNNYSVTSIGYNTKNLISRVSDEANDVYYEYFDIRPYKVKKVVQYGLLESEGNHLEFSYGFNTTSITDNKKTTTYIYDAYGNLSSISNLKDSSSLKDAYSIRQVNGSNGNTKNKIISSGIPIKYVNNYLKNVSFERENNQFVNSSSSISCELSSQFANSGSKSLKIISSNPNQFIKQEIEVIKDKKYTFSTYIKNTHNVRISLYYIDINNELVEKIEEIGVNNSFERYDVTINYPSNALSNLGIKICLIDSGTAYIDDIQLEEGEVSNNFNILENSDFKDGLEDWEVEVSEFETGSSDGLNINDYFQHVNINGENALKINMLPNLSTNLTKNIILSGKAGDVYNISFWYKTNGVTPSTDFSYNSVIINFANTEYNEYGHCVLPSTPLNPNDDNWQYFTYNFKAEYDYTGLHVTFLQSENANSLYLTNICIFKDIPEGEYIYDDDGKIIEIIDFNKASETIEYNNSNQIKTIKSKNDNSYHIEYDYDFKTLPISSTSPLGLIEENKYDDFGNTKTAITKNVNRIIESGKIYAIRPKGTSKYIRVINNILTIDDFSHDGWKVTEESSGFYSMSHPIINDTYISALSYAAYVGPSGYYGSQFILIPTGNGSYRIRLVSYNKYLKNDFEHLTVTDYIDGDEGFEFYFEELNNFEFIETDAEYDSTGRFTTKIIDSNLNEKRYEVNNLTGETTKEIYPNGKEIGYTYNDKNQLTRVDYQNKVIDFNYNSVGAISKIKAGSKEYQVEYDEFNNLKKIGLNNEYTFVNNIYETYNGNVSESKFGNGDSISYEYDDYDRMTKLIKSNDIYEFKYNNNGDLSKIISNDETIKYEFDLSKKLNKFINNDFKINYAYDTCNNIISKNFKLNDEEHSLTYNYDEDNMISSMIYDDKIVNYDYDKLGRLNKKVINNNYEMTCKYIKNGKRTTNIVSEIQNGLDKIKYNYDRNGNITHVYENGILQNRYIYNDYNEVIREDDYIDKITSRFKYDLEGNILYKKKYKLNTFDLISNDKYEYQDSKWKDKLTSFNSDVITYDGMGNPISIGTDINLTWQNGKELVQYKDLQNNIEYKYGISGLRTHKIVNGKEIKYYYENNKLIIEKNNDYMIYYIRNTLDDLIGFKYNNNIYYYIKNNLNDITGIMDEQFNVICKYRYDSWGNILSITDGFGNDISSNNMHIANINPFRYRSYYYDKETKLYYLSIRYYNPEWSRFINADLILTISTDCNSYNMFTYANNNPINYDDYNGTLFKSLKNAFNKVKKVGREILNTCKDVASKAASTVNEVVSSFCKTLDKIGETVSNGINKISSSIGSITKTTIKEVKGSTPIIPGLTQTVGTKTEISTGDSDKPIVFENNIDIEGSTHGIIFGGNFAIRHNSTALDKSIGIEWPGSSVELGINSMTNSVFIEFSKNKSTKDGVLSTSEFIRYDSHPILALGLCVVAVGVSAISIPIPVSWGSLAPLFAFA